MSDKLVRNRYAKAALYVAGTLAASQAFNAFAEATNINTIVQTGWRPVNDFIVETIEEQISGLQRPTYYIIRGMEDARENPAQRLPADDFAYRI